MKKSCTPPPSLKPSARCAIKLNFLPRAHWPAGLPGVAVNSVQIAGFEQDLVLDHNIEPTDHQSITALFSSLYTDLSTLELFRLYNQAQNVPWFPLPQLLEKYRVQPSENFFTLAPLLCQSPIGFQNWCADKKLSTSELLPLLSIRDLDLKPLMLAILQKNCSRSIGTQCLELAIELKLLGHDWTALQLTEPESSAEKWLQHLKKMRYPETTKSDTDAEIKVSRLPWPGASHVRWTRQGDRAGIEIKFFVSNPTDFKKHLDSLGKVQDLLEKDSDGPWIKH